MVDRHSLRQSPGLALTLARCAPGILLNRYPLLACTCVPTWVVWRKYSRCGVSTAGYMYPGSITYAPGHMVGAPFIVRAQSEEQLSSQHRVKTTGSYSTSASSSCSWMFKYFGAYFNLPLQLLGMTCVCCSKLSSPKSSRDCCTQAPGVGNTTCHTTFKTLP